MKYPLNSFPKIGEVPEGWRGMTKAEARTSEPNGREVAPRPPLQNRGAGKSRKTSLFFLPRKCRLGAAPALLDYGADEIYGCKCNENSPRTDSLCGVIDRSRIHVGTVVAVGGGALRTHFGLKLTGRILKIMVRRDFGLVIFGNRNLNFPLAFGV
jgi:hypothetical protein